ncbi:hypothetical protein CFOL_v3_26004 [Cephalotus follicularis]|uniref:RING-type domain-containing protein n=1 Tax=Cephalotus follicularis TaxID=3775 RepID=A0A1Q3CR35_CEPFO|nr:hypothetical protein CFOL_v3_26004 [Cephalotus follicularis]
MMAVQAQYPSNVLLLNRTGQDQGHDYLTQPQTGAGFLDQSHMIFTNGGANNPRKRGREIAASVPINPFSLAMQTQPPQVIDLSQLHNQQQHQQLPQQNVVSTGLHLSLQQHLQQNQHHYQHQNFNSSPLTSVFSHDFSSQIKLQREELDQFLQVQGEQLRRTLVEKRERHYRALLGVVEESIAKRLREKEAEVEKATRRNAELEARAAQLSVEAQVWHAKARAQEATAATLQAQLHQVIACDGGAAQDSRRGDDVLGCAEGQAEDADSAYVDPDWVVVTGPVCKACRKRVASVVLLPCRHLSLCTDCDLVVHACPLCHCLRNSSVEVYLSYGPNPNA